MVNGPADTSTPAEAGGWAVGGTWVGGTWVGIGVAGMGVADAGIGVGTCVAGIRVGVAITGNMVFVGRGAGLVGCTTVTDRSHPATMTANIERSRKVFLIVKSPFKVNHSHEKPETPPPLGEFPTGQVDSNPHGLDQGAVIFSNS
jgi:hypothetical protein